MLKGFDTPASGIASFDALPEDPPQTVRKRAFFNALAVLMNSFSNEIARRFAISFQK